MEWIVFVATNNNGCDKDVSRRISVPLKTQGRKEQNIHYTSLVDGIEYVLRQRRKEEVSAKIRQQYNWW